MLCVPKPQLVESLCDVIYVSDVDGDVTKKNSRTEDFTHGKCNLECASNSDIRLPETSPLMMPMETQIQNITLDTQDETVAPNLVSQYMLAQEKTSTSLLHFTRLDKSLRKQLNKNVPLRLVDARENTMDTSSNTNRTNMSFDLAHSTVTDMKQEGPAQTFLDSFDIVPKQTEHEFPHVSIVRKQCERNKLEGLSCKQCYEYYQKLGLSKEALKQKMNDSSRHREHYCAPKTPQHFWTLGFPDTAEMNEQICGNCPIDSSEIAGKGPRRRKPLEKRF